MLLSFLRKREAMSNESIDRERLAETFIQLCEIESPSREERRVADYLTDLFASLGAESVVEDDSAEKTGANCGNLIVRFPGTVEKEPLFFACHMDTVEPGRGVKVLRTGDLFTSRGNTVLGGDDNQVLQDLLSWFEFFMIAMCHMDQWSFCLPPAKRLAFLEPSLLIIALFRQSMAMPLIQPVLIKSLWGLPQPID